MTIAQSLTVSRTSGDLVITNTGILSSSAAYSIPEGGLAYPDFDFRLVFAADAEGVPGSVMTSAALGVGTLPLTIEVHGTSTADLQANRRALEDAFKQQSYTVTITVDGQSETYDAFPAWPKWGPVNSGHVRSHLAIATLSVTVNPA